MNLRRTSSVDPLPCQNINTVLNDIQQKLQKLDILDSISKRLRNIQGKFDIVEKDISQLKQSVNIHDQRLNTGGSEWNPIFGVEVYIIFGAYCRGCKLYKVCVGVNGDVPVIPGCCP
jgi:archaellum component FlaC